MHHRTSEGDNLSEKATQNPLPPNLACAPTRDFARHTILQKKMGLEKVNLGLEKVWNLIPEKEWEPCNRLAERTAHINPFFHGTL